MANAPGGLGWTPVRMWETTDPALGGDETAVDNIPLNQLTSRDQFLLDQISELKSALASQTNGGRLTIVQGNPTPNQFRLNSKIVWWVPYKSNKVALWTGSAWDVFDIPTGGLSIDTTSWPTPQTRDIFAYWNAATESVALETRTWANPNVLANKGYVIEDFQGVQVLATDRTRRYLGCVYNSAESTLPTRGIHDDQNIVDIWNASNQIERMLYFATDETIVTISHTEPRISKGAIEFDFFRLISGDPLQTLRMSGAGQMVNGTATNSAFCNVNFAGFNDRVSSVTAPRVFAGIQITASANAGLITSEAYFTNRGAQTIYIQDFRSGSGIDPRMQFLRAGMTWRY